MMLFHSPKRKYCKSVLFVPEYSYKQSRREEECNSCRAAQSSQEKKRKEKLGRSEDGVLFIVFDSELGKRCGRKHRYYWLRNGKQGQTKIYTRKPCTEIISFVYVYVCEISRGEIW